MTYHLIDKRQLYPLLSTYTTVDDALCDYINQLSAIKYVTGVLNDTSEYLYVCHTSSNSKVYLDVDNGTIVSFPRMSTFCVSHNVQVSIDSLLGGVRIAPIVNKKDQMKKIREKIDPQQTIDRLLRQTAATASRVNDTDDDVLKRKIPYVSVEEEESDSDDGVTIDLEDALDLNDETTAAALEKQIKLLEAVAERGEDEIDELKDLADEDRDNLANYNLNVSNERREIQREKERSEEHHRVFVSERDFTYAKMKKKIEEGKLKEEHIPPFFRAKYAVYKHMDNMGILYSDDAYEVYTDLIDELLDESTEPSSDVSELPTDEEDEEVLEVVSVNAVDEDEVDVDAIVNDTNDTNDTNDVVNVSSVLQQMKQVAEEQFNH